MEQTFQTSFIPKKPIVEEKKTSKRSVGLLVTVSIFIFITMALVAGGSYFYRETLTKNLVKMKSDLSLAKNRFEPEKIAQMKTLDKRLQASNEVLSKHIVVSPIFQALQAITLKTIRYTSFDYNLDNEEKIQVIMKGQGIGYRSIALQADLLAKNKNFIDPVFSNLSLDEKGNVLFELEFLIDKNFANYQQFIETTEEENTLPTNAISPTNQETIN